MLLPLRRSMSQAPRGFRHPVVNCAGLYTSAAGLSTGLTRRPRTSLPGRASGPEIEGLREALDGAVAGARHRVQPVALADELQDGCRLVFGRVGLALAGEGRDDDRRDARARP